MWVDAQRVDIARATWKAPRRVRVTVAAYIARWIDQHPSAKESTRELYRGLLAACIEPSLGRMPLPSVTPDMVRQWHHELGRQLADDAEGERQRLAATGRTPSRSTVRDGSARQAQAYRLLRAAMRTAYQDGLIVDQPCRLEGAGRPRMTAARAEHRVADRILTPQQIADVAAAMPSRYRALVLAGAWSGLRQGELLALRRRDLDLAATPAILHVRRRIRRTDAGEYEVDSPKSGASIRSVAIPGPLTEALRAHLAEFVPAGQDALLFTTVNGTTPARSNLSATFRRALAHSGAPEVRFHDLRHTAQVLAAESGATTAELMARMGHSTSAAAEIYMHARSERDAEIADRLGRVMEQARPARGPGDGREAG